MSTYKKEEAAKAAEAAVKAMFDGSNEGPRSVDVTFNEDGSNIIVGDVVFHEDKEGSVPYIISHKDAPEFIRKWEAFEEEQMIEMLDKEAVKAFKNEACVFCYRKPCIIRTEHDTLRAIGDSMEVSGHSPRSIRHRLYRHVTGILHGHLGPGVRKKLPRCIHCKIMEMYPNEDGTDFVGFKTTGEEEDENN